MSGHLARWVAIGVMAVVGVVVAAAPAEATETPKPDPKTAGRVAFGLQPATRGTIDGRPGYRYGVTPGAKLADQVAVRNLSTTSATFKVYATDAVTSGNGDFGLLARASRPRDVGRWLTVGGKGFNGSVTVGARGTVVLPLALSVPSDAQPGDHTGGVIVSLATASKNRDGTNVILDQRVAARVFIRVSGPQRPALTIKPVHAEYRGTWNPLGRGRTTVAYTVTNTGNINLGGRQRVVVRGLIGPGQRSAAIVDLGLLLPGGSVEVTARVPKTLPLIRERAQVSIVPLVQVGDQVSGLQTYTGTATFWAVPWTLLALLLMLAAAAGLGRRARRARRGGRGRRPAASPGDPVVLGERRARRLGVSTTLAVAALVSGATAAHAADTPYNDPAATGGITLCDSARRPITSGSTSTTLAATVVGGGAAQAPYDGETGSAGLFAFQPRRGALPGEWSGQGLTALSRFTEKAHPAVEILPRDATLRTFLDGYPALWDGLVQLRIYLRAAGAPTNTSSYSATSLRVSAGRWVQVGPAAGDVCGAGTATSVVRLLGLPTTAPTPRTSAGASASPTAAATPPPTATASARAAAAPSPSRPVATTDAATTDVATTDVGTAAAGTARPAGASTTDDGTGRWPVVAAVAVLMAAGFWRLRRKRGARDNS